MSWNPFFCPPGETLGDAFPFFYEDLCHLFVLQPPAIAHYVSQDLINWEARPAAVRPGPEGSPDSGMCATGSIVESGGRFFLFYTGCQNICLATSQDLIAWTKYEGNPVLVAHNRLYDSEYFHDPFVFYNQHDAHWWMLFGSRDPALPLQRSGCVGLAKSVDLLNWELCPPLWSPGIGPHADCPKLIRHGSHWYLFYLQRNTRYRLAESFAGPFRRPPQTRDLFSVLAAAGSRPAFDGRRWIVWPFVMRLHGRNEYGEWNYGGSLAIPRQLDFHANGSITERPLPEMIEAMESLPAVPNPLAGAQTLVGRWEYPGANATRNLDAEGGTLFLAATPADLYLETDVTMAAGDMDLHILVRTSPSLDRGYKIALHPAAGNVSVRPISPVDVDPPLVIRSAMLPVGRPQKVRVFLCGTILEVFVDDRVSVTCRLYRHRTGAVAFECRDGRATFSSVIVHPLQE